MGSISEQFSKIKDNWLLILFLVFIFLFLSGVGNIFSSSSSMLYSKGGLMTESLDYGASGASYEASRGYLPYDNSDFAPEVEDRKITKTSSLTNEVKKGDFFNQESKLKNIISSSGSFLLNENVNKYEEGWKSYHTGSYQIKVDSQKYSSVISQLKDIGEIKYFRENARDITGTYTNIEIEIQTEKARLLRYETLLQESKEVQEKISLTDKIFDQERRIKYLEDSLNRIDKKIEYSTIYFTLNEKRSEYIGISFVKISELIRSFISSLNSLLKFLVIVIPWAVAFFIVRFVWNRFFKTRDKDLSVKAQLRASR